MTDKHDFLLSIGGSVVGSLIGESNLVLSSIVYIITGVYTSVKLYHLVKEKKNGRLS